MKSSPNQSLEADGPNTQTESPLPPRDRVLEVACGMFAEAGFHGTHLREICKRAGTNVAGICYHFESKEGLYQAVMMEAGRQLSAHQENFVASENLPPEQRLLALIECLLERLNTKRSWIAKLLLRELVEPGCGAHAYVASGLECYFLLLQSALRELVGYGSQSETVRLHTLILIGECVFYSLAAQNEKHPLIQLAAPSPERARWVQLLTRLSIRNL